MLCAMLQPSCVCQCCIALRLILQLRSWVDVHMTYATGLSLHYFKSGSRSANLQRTMKPTPEQLHSIYSMVRVELICASQSVLFLLLFRYSPSLSSDRFNPGVMWPETITWLGERGSFTAYGFLGMLNSIWHADKGNHYCVCFCKEPVESP